MAISSRTIAVQYDARPAKRVRVDDDVAALGTELIKNGINNQDVDTLIRSSQLNTPPPTDAYGNGIYGGVLKPMLAAARDPKKRISVDGQRVQFASSDSAKYFYSQLAKFLVANARQN